ncbi:BON domain-containing protein [Acinetobacter shaoyimingii]|uniref:BON domain-containing protein n=1 Tax=Acinetobacter shaoyimingii TaxID=2715164 RepID=A0A6G8RX53_9GAMM|nr:BON domain-containing protein [Acinetobacter shaoyimingii]QIO06430.1 BON domain-containing protein [Acinetobacter shaoyimingii]
MLSRIVITMMCVASLSGCASFISKGTGTEPIGVSSGSRSLGQVFIDSSIERTAKINLYKLDARFKKSRVNINSFHSNVLLTGQVPDEHLKQLAEDNVNAMSDVKTIHNYITVGSQIGYNTIMQDTAVTTNTRSLIMRAPIVSDSKVHVHTEDGVLYVMGRLNNAEEKDLESVLSKVGNITKIVMLVDNIESGSTQPQGTTTVPSAYVTPLVNNQVETPVAIEPYSAD